MYEEVYTILWSEFALHDAALVNKSDFDGFQAWLLTHNPRAIQCIQHLHLRVEDVVDRRYKLAKDYKVEDKATFQRISSQIASYPCLCNATNVFPPWYSARSTSHRQDTLQAEDHTNWKIL
jgi:hypothetical protein